MTEKPRERKIATRDERKLPLTDAQKILLVAQLTRDETLLQSVGDKLDTVRHFDEADRVFGLVWSCVRRFYEVNERVPDPTELHAEISNERQNNRYEELDDDELQLLKKIRTSARELEGQVLLERRVTARRYLQQFLEEKLQGDLRKRIDTDASLSMFPLLEAYTEQALSITSLQAGDVGVPFSSTADMEGELDSEYSLDKITTGSSYLDDFMGSSTDEDGRPSSGGMAAGEVYGFTAPYGVGKTTQAVKLLVDTALLYQSRWVESGKTGALPIVYGVFYEEIQLSLRQRLLAYCGKVDRASIETANWAQTMSSRKLNNYKPYERERFKSLFDAKIKPPGEWERIQIAMRQINRNLRLIDFTGARADYRDNARSMVDGIAGVIAHDQASCGNPGVALVVVDYVGAAADRWCDANNKDPDRHLRLAIAKFPLRAVNKLAAPYSCPVWLMHQASTTANARAACVRPTITEVSECRSFFENAAFGFMVGTKTLDNMVILANVKQRRAGPRRDKILLIDGRFGDILDMSSTHRVANSRIIAISDYSQFVDDAPRPAVSDMPIDGIGF